MTKKRIAKLTYDDIGYADQRLTGTFIMYEGKVVQVRNVDLIGRDIVANLRDKEGVGHSEMLDNLSLLPLPLGYVNYHESAGFVYRMPMRRDWRQGTRPSQLGVYNTVRSSRFPDPRRLEHLYHLEDTCNRKYYNIYECMEMIEDGYETRSFDADFAIHSDYSLLYRGRNVGSVNPDNAHVTLNDDRVYLTEALEEAMGVN